jgi:hypothetical protein
MPRSCATATPEETNDAPGCAPESGNVKLSCSNAWVMAPCASAAAGAHTLAPVPKMAQVPPVPIRRAWAMIILLQGNCEPNRIVPTVSAMQSLARCKTSAGISS